MLGRCVLGRHTKATGACPSAAGRWTQGATAEGNQRWAEAPRSPGPPQTEQQRTAMEDGGVGGAQLPRHAETHTQMCEPPLWGALREAEEREGVVWPHSHHITEPSLKKFAPPNPAVFTLGRVCPPALLWPFHVEFLQTRPARRSRMVGRRVPPQGPGGLCLWGLPSAPPKLSCCHRRGDRIIWVTETLLPAGWGWPLEFYQNFKGQFSPALFKLCQDIEKEGKFLDDFYEVSIALIIIPTPNWNNTQNDRSISH